MMDSITRKGFLCFCILAMGGASAFGQRVFVVPEGQTPTLGQTYTIDAKGGEELRLEVWVENLPAGEKLKEWNVVMPCSATTNNPGSIDNPSPSQYPWVETEHPHYVFAGITVDPNTTLSIGSCPGQSGPYISKGVALGNGVAVTEPRYMATFRYHASDDAQGIFTINPKPATYCVSSRTYLRKDVEGEECFEDVEVGAITIMLPVSARMFLVPAGTDPTTATPGLPFEVTLRGGDSITVEVFLENTAAEALLAYQITIPCAVSGGIAGSVEYVPPPFVDIMEPDFAFAGVAALSPVHEGTCESTLPCDTFSDCWSGGLCDLVTHTCYSGPRLATVLFNSDDAVVITEPRYLGEFTYMVSEDAETGAEGFTIRPVCIPADLCPGRYASNDKTVLKADGPPLNDDFPEIPFTLDELVIRVPRAQCCIGAPPVCDMLTELECTAAGGEFRADQTCDDLCECVSDAQCNDDDTCTADYCVGGDCVNRPIPHGDIFPCEGDGVVDIDDIVTILNAFAQREPVCPSPCASSAVSGAAITIP